MPDDRLRDEEKSFLAIVRWHAGHERSDQVAHCLKVRELVDDALALEGGDIPARRAMLLAALGHDLYEDSDNPHEEIVEGFGPDVDALIQYLTHKEREGESVVAYVSRVADSPDDARLIKCGDLVDNFTELVKQGQVRVDPVKWVGIVRDKMEPMSARLSGVPLDKCPKAGGWLIEQVLMRREAFWAEVRRVRPDLC